MLERRTKIVATIGPATAIHETVRELVRAGMDAARLNMSHGTHEDHTAAAKIVRAVQEELGRPIALIADLQGPKLRIGRLAELRELHDRRAGRRHRRHERPQRRAADRAGRRLGRAPPGHDVLIDDGLVRLRVDELDEGRAVCTVLVGGEVKSQQGRQPARARRSRSRR